MGAMSVYTTLLLLLTQKTCLELGVPFYFRLDASFSLNRKPLSSPTFGVIAPSAPLLALA